MTAVSRTTRIRTADIRTADIRSADSRTVKAASVRGARQHGPSEARRAARPLSRPMCRAHLEALPVPRHADRISEATYRRRRAIVGTLLAVLVAVGSVAAHDVLAGSGGVPASAAESQPAHVTTVVATPGDTLWSIADRYRGDISITRYVDTLVDLNGGASIEAGQLITLP